MAYTSKLSPVQTFLHKYTEETDVPCSNGQLTEEINTQFGFLLPENVTGMFSANQEKKNLV